MAFVLAFRRKMFADERFLEGSRGGGCKIGGKHDKRDLLLAKSSITIVKLKTFHINIVFWKGNQT